MFNSKFTIMKRLILALLLVGASATIATNANAQVYIGARIGIRAPFHRAYFAPQVVYNAPVCNEPVPAPYYDNVGVVGANFYNSYPIYRGYSHYPYYRHEIARGYYRESRIRHGRRW